MGDEFLDVRVATFFGGATGAVTWSLNTNGHPALSWLSITNTGVLNGTPTTYGTTPSFTVSATDSAAPTPQTASRTYTVNVQGPLTMADRDFLVKVRLAGLWERPSGEQAQERSQNDAVKEAGEALHYAHGQGLIHRDVKPENILLSQGHALVADFGIARAAGIAAGDG